MASPLHLFLTGFLGRGDHSGNHNKASHFSSTDARFGVIRGEDAYLRAAFFGHWRVVGGPLRQR